MNSRNDTSVVEFQDRLTGPESGFKPTPVKYAADAFKATQDLKNPHTSQDVTVFGNYVRMESPTQATLASIVAEKGHAPRLVIMPLNAGEIRDGKYLTREPQSFALKDLASPVALSAALSAQPLPAANVSTMTARPLRSRSIIHGLTA